MPAVIPAIVAGVALAGAGTAMAMSNKAKAPAGRNLQGETANTLQAQLALAPDIYNAEARYQPQYTALSMRNLRDAMLGTDNAPGLLSLYTNDIAPVEDRLEAQRLATQREADIGALEQFAPRVTRAIESADPAYAELQGELRAQALNEVRMGSSLSPAERREMVQASAAGQAMGGRAQQPFSLYERMLTQGGAGEARKFQRRQFASSMLAGGPSGGVDLTSAILGRPSRVQMPTGGGFLQMAGGVPRQASGTYDLFPDYAGDLYNTNYNAQAAASMANFNQRASTAQGLMSMGGGLMSGGFGQMGRR